jgi:hypothetical protein
MAQVLRREENKYKGVKCMKDNESVYEPIYNTKNIEFVFQKLLFSLIESINFKEYIDSKEEFQEILEVINKWINNYVNNNEILEIDKNEFENVKKRLFELDNKYLNIDGLYAEECYDWILQLEILMMKNSK